MPHLHEANPITMGSQPFHEPIDAIAGKAEDDINTPSEQSFKEHVRSGLGHECSRLNR